MNKLIPALCLGLLLVMPNRALAEETYDMANITCKEILEDQETLTYMLFWIDGYLSHKKNNMLCSDESMKSIAEAIAAECQGSPNKKLGSMIKKW